MKLITSRNRLAEWFHENFHALEVTCSRCKSVWCFVPDDVDTKEVHLTWFPEHGCWLDWWCGNCGHRNFVNEKELCTLLKSREPNTSPSATT